MHFGRVRVRPERNRTGHPERRKISVFAGLDAAGDRSGCYTCQGTPWRRGSMTLAALSKSSG
jgi:hypothetical protein